MGSQGDRTNLCPPRVVDSTMGHSHATAEVEAPPDNGDDALMFAYKDGDPQAFAKLLQRHEKPVYRFCLRALGNPEAAADATQEVFMRVVKNAPSWERKAKFTTWLYTIARNFCIDEARKGRFRRTESLNEKLGQDDESGAERLDQVADQTPGSDRLVDSRQIREVVDAAVAELPEEQRDVFVMRQYGGLSFRDIAEATGIGENTVKSRMRYALGALRKALQTAGIHPPPEP